MPHYYVSIDALQHKVFKYAGYVHPLNEDAYRKAFEKYGPLGLPNGQPRIMRPFKVLTFDEYMADRITEDGSPYGDQPYTPKQIILTWRDDKSTVWRVIWTHKSSPKEEEDARVTAEEGVWMRHVFQVGDETAWDKALERHEEIEAQSGDRTCD